MTSSFEMSGLNNSPGLLMDGMLAVNIMHLAKLTGSMCWSLRTEQPRRPIEGGMGF